jgi:glycosyltransferase involved in cell wall biosynthesis
MDEGNLAIEAEKLGVKIHQLKHLKRNLDPLSDLKALMELSHFFDLHSFDLVHTHSSKAGIIGRIAARHSGVPVVLHTVHGLAFDEFQSRLNNLIYSSAERFCSNFCDCILTVCETMKEKLLEIGVQSVPIETVYSGFDLEPFLKILPTDPKPNDRFTVGMIARMFPLKGHEDLLKLAPDLLTRNDDIDLYLVGDGPLQASWTSWLERHPHLRNRITFTGRVPAHEIPMHLSKMDILIHLSMREGLPRAVAQALASARPVCVYDIGGSKEIVKDGETGYLVFPGEITSVMSRIEEIRADRKKGSLMGMKGRNKVIELFAVDKMGEHIKAIYEESFNYPRV